MLRDELKKFLNQYLNIYDFQDYGPNGLQIEGKKEIKKIAYAVSATKETIDEAVKQKADAMIVHHGLFWKFHGPKTITGPFAQRVIPLVKNAINLFGYHLPLDAHIEVGNAAQIAKKLKLEKIKPFGDHKGSPTGVQGHFAKAVSPAELQTLLKGILNHDIITSTPEGMKEIGSLGIITGGANNDWPNALREGLDAFLTGEISEYNWYEAKEAGVCYLAGGHHATERFGVLALKELIETTFPEVENFYIETDNPA